VVEELRRRGVEPTIVATGQHQSLLRGTPAESTMAPQVSLGIESQNDPMAYVRACEWGLRRVWATDRPEMVMIQGDTASAYAGAAVAHGLKIPVAHVEAGIRTGDRRDPWPEEDFRFMIDGVATWRWCPTWGNQEHICDEALERLRELGPNRKTSEYMGGDLRPGRTIVTGNSGIDALYSHTKPTDTVWDHIAVTLHRRESFGAPLAELVRGICLGAQRYAGLTFFWPTHPNPQVQAALPGNPPRNLILQEPRDTVAFADLLSRCRAVITDSGGVQEEAAALGIPCIVAREKTDRPESVEVGLAKVVGRTEQGILDGLDWALGFSTRPDPSTVFGDGKASPRIVSHLLESV